MRGALLHPDLLASIRYLLVGVVNTLVGLGIIYFCMWALGLGNVVSNAIGYSVGVLVSFTLNRRWTFRHEGPRASAFVRFVTVLGVAYGVNLATVLFAIEVLHIDRYLAQAIGVVPYTITGFLGSRLYAFASAPKAGTGSPRAGEGEPRGR